MRATKTRFDAQLLFATACALAAQGDSRAATPAVTVEIDGGFQEEPDNEQAHRYRSHKRAPHTASGDGLHKATVGRPATFTIQLVGDELGSGHGLLPGWESLSSSKFIYVWIANKDQIFIAEVVDGGNKNSTLTATYKSDFPGDYLVYIDEVQQSEEGEGVPILGSPFSLTIAGDDPTLNVNTLPVCSSHEDSNNDIADTFWRPGTWLSSKVASAAHGVMRNGLDNEPTWLLVLGGSVQRGVFLTLIDMVLAAGQKHAISSSVLQKCWGYADVRVGNLRLTYQVSYAKKSTTSPWMKSLRSGPKRGVSESKIGSMVDTVKWDRRTPTLNASYLQDEQSSLSTPRGIGSNFARKLAAHTRQDMRLFMFTVSTDSVVCNNEKLTSGSTSAFIHNAGEFLASTVFPDGGWWPTVMMAESRLLPATASRTQFSVEVLMDALPPSWKGKLLFMEQMAGFGNYWTEENPTMTAMKDVGIRFRGRWPDDDNGLGKMDGYQSRDPHVSFMSVFPMYQAKLFENEKSKHGIRRFGGSQHFHFVSANPSLPETRNGTIMVDSTVTEMLANIIIGRAVETKTKLYAKTAASTDEMRKIIADVGKSFQVCSDCPASLLPFHVKAIPERVCEIFESLPGEAKTGEVWTGDLCPDWCMKQTPVSQTKTESDVVNVRECSGNIGQP